jgi:hypothetical protein
VISVDTKKKEKIGNFKNDGGEYRAKKQPRKVLDQDFPIKELGKISPYGVYNVNNNVGFVNVGTNHDMGETHFSKGKKTVYNVRQRRE